MSQISLSMPYLYLLLDDESQAAIRQAAESIQAGSPFISQLDERAELGRVPFHLTVLGSLHMYSENDIKAALERLAAATGPIRGRFVKWECSPATLRCTVEVDLMSAFADASQAELPRGRPWGTPAHITIGSTRKIDAAQRSAFLAAVETAFPITDASVFSVTHVGYEGGADRSRSPLPPLPLTGEADGRDGLSTVAVKARLAARTKELEAELANRRSSASGRTSNDRRPASVTLSAPPFHSKRALMGPATGASAMEVSQPLGSSTGPTGIGKKKRRPHRQHRRQVAAVISTRWPGGRWEEKQVAEPQRPRWD